MPIEKRSPEEQAANPLDEDDLYVRSRAGDRSIWSKSSYYLEKYRLLAYLLFSALVALGFGFRTPQTQFAEIHDRFDPTEKTCRISLTHSSTVKTQ